jgi:hypothetical protein
MQAKPPSNDLLRGHVRKDERLPRYDSRSKCLLTQDSTLGLIVWLAALLPLTTLIRQDAKLLRQHALN